MPGKQQVAQLVGGRHAPGDDLEVGKHQRVAIGILGQHAAGDALVVDALAGGIGPVAGRQHAHVRLFRKGRQRGFVDFGGDHDLDKLAFKQQLGGFHIEAVVEGDDATECRQRIAGIGMLVGFARAGGEGDTAGIGVLDDDAGRCALECLDALERGIGIGEVVVGKLLAGKHACAGNGASRHIGFHIQGGGLMRILAVAQKLLACVGKVQARGEGFTGFTLRACAKPAGDAAVVAGRMRIGLGRESTPHLDAGAAMRQGIEHFGIVGRIADDDHVFVVLGRRAQHGRATDIDVLDGGGQRAIRACGDGIEGIQVDHQQVDRADAMLAHHRIVDAAAAEQAAMHERVQGLDPTIHDFRKARHRADLGDPQLGITQGVRRAPGRDQANAQGIEPAGEIEQAGLVGHAEQRASDGCKGCLEHGINRRSVLVAQYSGGARGALSRARSAAASCAGSRG